MLKTYFGVASLLLACVALPMSAGAFEVPITRAIQQIPTALTGLIQPTQPQQILPPTPSLNEIRQGARLQLGQKGSAVQAVRQLLAELDYPAEGGSEFDSFLEVQIGRFQEDHHLAIPRDPHWGQIGANTLEVLQRQAIWGRYDAAWGQKLATYARKRVSGGRRHCYDYVARAIHANMPPFLEGMHAYMAADHLARSPRFKEIKVSIPELETLPAGALVVWGKGNSRSGHISIANGQGDEISDHVGRQMLSHYGGAPARVFIPVKPRRLNPDNIRIAKKPETQRRTL